MKVSTNTIKITLGIWIVCTGLAILIGNWSATLGCGGAVLGYYGWLKERNE